MALTVADLLVKLSGDPTAFERQMKKVAAEVEKFGKGMEKAGKTMTAKVSLPILAVGGAAAKMAADFDHSLNQIVGLVGVAREQVDAWRDSILALGPATGVSVKELGEAMFFITSAGLRGKVALDTLTAAAKASAAGLGDVKAVSHAAVSAVNAYGEANLSAEQAVAVLVATVREGNLEASSLAPVLGSVLPIASQLGASFNDVGAAIAAMTRKGTNAAVSATQLNSVFMALMKPTDDGRVALARMGTSFEEIRKQIKEKGLITALHTLRNAVGDNYKAMTDVIPNVRALRGVLNMLSKDATATDAIFKSLAGTTAKDLNDAFSEAEQDGLTQMKMALGDVQVAMVRLGDIVLPTIVPMFQAMARGAADVANVLKHLSPAQRQWVVGIGMAAVAIGPLLWGVGATIKALGAMTKTIHGVAFAQVGMAKATGTSSAAFATQSRIIGGFSKMTLLAKAGLVAMTGVMAYQLTKAILEATGAYDAMAEVFGLAAKGPMQDNIDALAENGQQFDLQLEAYNSLRQAMGRTSAEWIVQGDHTKNNARLLVKLTAELQKVQKAEMVAAGAVKKHNQERLTGQIIYDRTRVKMKAAMDDLKTRTEAAASAYGLLSKAQVALRLKEMAQDWHNMAGEGYNMKAAAEAMGDEMLGLLVQSKDYKVEATDSVKTVALAMEKQGVAGIAAMAKAMEKTGSAVVLAGATIKQEFESIGKMVGDTLSGGFGRGIEEGVAFGEQQIAAFRERIAGGPPMVIKVIPDDGVFMRALADILEGRVPPTGGINP